MHGPPFAKKTSNSLIFDDVAWKIAVMSCQLIPICPVVAVKIRIDAKPPVP